MRGPAESPTDAVAGVLVLGGALLVLAVSPLEHLDEDLRLLHEISAPAPAFVLAGVALAVATQWLRGATRGVTVLALLCCLGFWFLATLVAPGEELYLYLSPGWVGAFAIYALFLGVGVAGVRGTESRAATPLLVLGVAVVFFLSFDRIYVGPPDYVQFRFAGDSGLVLAVTAVGVAVEWLSIPRGWTRATSALLAGAALSLYFLGSVVQPPPGGVTTFAGWVGSAGSVALLLGGALASARGSRFGAAVRRRVA